MASEQMRNPVNDRLFTPEMRLVLLFYQPVQVSAIASMDHQLLVNIALKPPWYTLCR